MNTLHGTKEAKESQIANEHAHPVGSVFKIMLR